MGSEIRSAAERALESHAAFERADGAFEVTTTPLEASVALREADGAVSFRVGVEAPSLDAVVVDETVAPVVEEGWLEAFERRLEDVGGVTRIEPEPPTVGLVDGGATVRVSTGFETADVETGVEDAKALVDFVEGTYVEGIIPGYTYREPAQSLLERARGRAG